MEHYVNVEFSVKVTGDFTCEEAEQIVTEGLMLPSNYNLGSLDVWTSKEHACAVNTEKDFINTPKI